MSYIIEQKVKQKTYVYQVDSYWDKDKKQPRQRRTYLGRKDEITGEIVTTQKSSKESSKNNLNNTCVCDAFTILYFHENTK